MTWPLLNSLKKNTKVNVEHDNDNNNDDDDDDRDERIYSKNYLNYIICNLTSNKIMSLYFCLILILMSSWFLIVSGYYLNIIDAFNMRKYDDMEESFIDHSELSLINMSCDIIPHELRFDCHPENGPSELECINRGCCWNAIHNYNDINDRKKIPLDIPYCFYPHDWKLYEYINITQSNNDFVGYLEKNNIKSFYNNDLALIKMESVSVDESTLRVKIYDPINSRYEPQYPIRDDPKPFNNNLKLMKYKFEIDKLKPGGFRIRRSFDKNTVIFDSINAGGFIFSDQLLQISTLLPSSNIYGLGEHRTNIKLNINWQSYTIFNKDQPPTENANLYGSHPFYLIIEDTGNCHGVLLLNSNAMDIILQPTPALTYRTIGGIFDFYFFMGPTPADVLQQYSNIISKPFLPPYWSLGFHLCRFGYGTLNKTIEVWNRTRSAGIPFDTQWNDLDYMDNANDFTYNKDKFKDLPKFIDQLHAIGMHYIPLIDPGISSSEINGTYPPYDDGIRYNIFIQDNNTGQPFVGKVWNRVSTVWPDFTHINAYDYWYTMMKRMHDNFKYDGAWIDMNEPSNFYNGHINGCTTNIIDYPPYMPNVIGNLLSTKTLCMNAKHYHGYHYNIHNIYATAEASITNLALKKIRNKRPFIVSRGTWIGHGRYGAHWTGDIYSSWHDLKMSIPEILAFSLFHIPMVGADICGFDGNTTESLCNRWMQLGAFYPFSRNHNSDDTIEQDPVAMGDLVVKSSRKALMIRYRFLPYLYTLFARAHVFGDTVARPLFIDFIYDKKTWNIDAQFLWGSAFMIIPVLNENDTEVMGYLPRGIWYNYYTKKRIISNGEYFKFHAAIDTIPIVIRGGFILPGQTPGLTTTECRKNNHELLIGLDKYGQANGEIYIDDGDSLDSIEMKQYQWIGFILKNQTLIMHEMMNGLWKNDIIFNSIEIMGITQAVSKVKVNDNNVYFVYDEKRYYLIVNSIPLTLNDKFILQWE